jgi:hypothetical protein
MSDDIDSKRVIVFTKDTRAAPYSDDLDLLGDSPGGVTTVGTLRASIGELLPGLDAIIKDVKAKGAAAGLEEVTVALGVNAKGSVGVLGTGTEVGGTATLTLKFKTK